MKSANQHTVAVDAMRFPGETMRRRGLVGGATVEGKLTRLPRSDAGREVSKRDLPGIQHCLVRVQWRDESLILLWRRLLIDEQRCPIGATHQSLPDYVSGYVRTFPMPSKAHQTDDA